MNLTMGAWGRLHQLWERPLGPLFEKELRVVSRRKGWYALRTAYVSLLLVLVVVTWGIAMARASGGSQTLAMTARMSQAGQSLVMTLVWFQFLAMQLLAVGIMSTAVSEEARGQTLSVLFTTPITGGQFILGKLASRMLQLVLLMAMGLPMLGLLRVYGGIDWPFVVRGFAITAGATLFAGAMSLHLSAWSKKPHVVIVLSLLGLGVVFGGMGFVLSSALTLLCTLNPYVLLAEYTAQVVSPGGGFAGPGISCATHVAIMAAAAGAFTLAAMIRLRSRALKLAFGAESVKQTARQKARGQRRHAAAQERAIMHVDRPPLIWRGTLSDRIRGRRLRVATYTILAFGTVAYAICYIGILQNPGGSWNRFYAFLMFFAMGLNFIAQLRTASMAASSVAGEKEAKTLPILLTLPISDQELLASKETIAFRRNLPLWILVAWIGLVGVIVGIVFSFRRTPASPGSEVVGAWDGVYRLVLLALVPLAIAAVTVMFRALYRGMPVNIKRKTVLIVATAYVLLSVLDGAIHPRGDGIAQLLFMPILLVAQIYQSIGLGLYCGCRSRTTTRAIVLTFIGILMILFLENFVFMGILRVVVMWLQGTGAFAMRFFSFGYLLVHLLVQTLVAWWCYKQAKKWFRKDLFSGA